MAIQTRGAFVDDYSRRSCQNCAGVYFDEMIASYEATCNFLHHADPVARAGALATISTYWSPESYGEDATHASGIPDGNRRPPAELIQIFWRLATGDKDPKVRIHAFRCLNAVYFESANVRVARYYAKVVRDENEPVLVRKMAYAGLFSIIPNNVLPALYALKFPEDVDWEFVSRAATML